MTQRCSGLTSRIQQLRVGVMNPGVMNPLGWWLPEVGRAGNRCASIPRLTAAVVNILYLPFSMPDQGGPVPNELRSYDHAEPFPTSKLISGAIDDGRYVFVSGTVGFITKEGDSGVADENFLVPLAGGLEEQTRACLTHISRILQQADLTLNDVVKVNAYLENPDRDRESYNRVFKEFFGAHRPTRTTVGVHLVGGLLVEIECIAKRPQTD